MLHSWAAVRYFYKDTSAEIRSTSCSEIWWFVTLGFAAPRVSLAIRASQVDRGSHIELVAQACHVEIVSKCKLASVTILCNWKKH